MRRAITIAFILIILQFAIGLYLYPTMPDQIAVHWDINGEADGYGSKLVGFFLIPAVELLIIPLFLVLPRIDPKTPKEKMTKSYDWFILVFTFYMFYVFGLSTAWNMGYRFDFMRLLVPMLGTLFIGIGIILGDVEMNWFMGIRTPWTMSNRTVWEETHRIGGRLFKISGLLAFGGVFFSGWISLGLSILPVMFSGVYVVYYSYKIYKQIDTT